MLGIQVYHRKEKRSFEEKVLGGAWIRLGYQNFLGKYFVGSYVFQKVLSNTVGFFQKSALSLPSISNFIKNYSIKMEEFVTPADGFKSFNDFFIRKFKPTARAFPAEPKKLGAMAEGRLSVFPILNTKTKVFVKGVEVSLTELVGEMPDTKQIADFEGGHVWVFRLCPVDYHRFHFPDAGDVKAVWRLGDKLDSVNPWALQQDPRLMLKNERVISLFDSQNMGSMILVEVGALCVGTIKQTYGTGKPVERGEEKGYFEFGGSTVILITDSTIQPATDILENSLNKKIETFVELGEIINHS